MPDPLSLRAWYVATVTITTKRDLSTLITQAYAAISASLSVPPFGATELRLYADDANSVDILFGDEFVNATNYGIALHPGGSDKWGPYRMPIFPLADTYVQSADAITPATIRIIAIPG